MADPAPRLSATPHDARAAVRAWCLYDWANSAFATSVVAAILPVYFASTAARTMAPHQATAQWGYANAVAMLAAGVLGPVLGAWADRRGRRKPLLMGCVVVGASATLAMALAPPGDWRWLLATFGLGFLAFALGNALYDSLLVSVASREEAHRVSARGFALGYLGGGLLLALHVAMIIGPHWFGLPNVDAATRVALGSVALWWFGFSLPLFRRVPEPPAAAPALGHAPHPIAQVWRTTRSLTRYPELLRFLIAFWLYSDGIGTIVKMATVYGSELGIGRNHLIGALLVVQLLGSPASLMFGRLAQPLGPQIAVAVALAGYVVITLCGFFMTHAVHFWLIAVLVALFQGGSQALSRSMFASLVPRGQMAEMFGFYSVSEKLAGIVGPLMFAAIAQVSGTGRYAVLSLLPMFVGGAWLLLTVDLRRGAARASPEAAGLKAQDSG